MANSRTNDNNDKPKKKKIHIFIDFDETMLDGHSHNTIDIAFQNLRKQTMKLQKSENRLSAIFENNESRAEYIKNKQKEFEKKLNSENSILERALSDNPDPYELRGKDEIKASIKALQQIISQIDEGDIESLLIEPQQKLEEVTAELAKQRAQQKNIKENIDAQWELVKHLEPLAGEDITWKDVLTECINEGHYLHIVTFNSYGALLPKILEKTFELDAATRKQIDIVAFLPSEEDTVKFGKNKHILQGFSKIEGREMTEADAKSSVFVDDSTTNTKLAEEGLKINTINATPRVRGSARYAHLAALQQTVKQFANPDITAQVQVATTKPKSVRGREDNLNTLPMAATRKPVTSVVGQGSIFDKPAAGKKGDAPTTPPKTPRGTTPRSGGGLGDSG